MSEEVESGLTLKGEGWRLDRIDCSTDFWLFVDATWADERCEEAFVALDQRLGLDVVLYHHEPDRDPSEEEYCYYVLAKKQKRNKF